MITKIFYSLVLFPKIQFGTVLNTGFSLFKIEEEKLWLLRLYFTNKTKKTIIIYFKHKKFLDKNDRKNLNNWKVYGQNLKLVEEIVNLLKEEDNKRDFNFFDDKILNRKRPFWVVLTITSKCNIFCYYCFNDIDYDLKYRNIKKNLWLAFWKKVVDELYDAWTRVIILTWWEPMMATFFWELLDYLKEKNIFVHLNTNWTLLTDDSLERLNKNYSINIMVSMHEFNDEDFYEVNKKWLEMTFWINNVPKKFKYMFSDKIKQLRKINNLKNISLEFLTILTPKNILNLEKLYEFVLLRSWINIHNWQFFRLYATKNNKWISQVMMKLAIEKIYKLNKKYNVDFKIVDPVPFCVTPNVDKAAKVIDGVLSDTHDVKTIITTDGYIQLMSAYDNNFWNIKKDSIKEVFLESEFVKKMLNNWFLPKECRDCLYKDLCKWWSRMDWNIVYGSYDALDPIADFKNKVTVRNNGFENS